MISKQACWTLISIYRLLLFSHKYVRDSSCDEISSFGKLVDLLVGDKCWAF
jgi:hypothetical protein